MPHLGMIPVAQNYHGPVPGAVQPDNGDQTGQAAGVEIDFPSLEILLKPCQTIAAPIGFGQLNGRVKIIGAGQLVGFEHLFDARFGNQSLSYALLLVHLVYLWSGIHFWLASRTLPEDLAAVGRAAQREARGEPTLLPDGSR